MWTIGDKADEVKERCSICIACVTPESIRKSRNDNPLSPDSPLKFSRALTSNNLFLVSLWSCRSKTWMCQTCHSDMVTILPDVAPENVIKASLKADEMPPEFSFGYEADKKKAAEDDAQGSSNGTGGTRPSSQPAGDKEMETKDSTATAPSSPTRTTTSSQRTAVVSPGLIAAEARALSDKTKDSSPATTPIAADPSTDLPKEQGSASTTSSPSPAAPTFRSAHYNPAQPQPTNPPTRPHQAQAQQTQQIHRVNSSPVWLDILIIGFGGVLVALVFRRFFM